MSVTISTKRIGAERSVISLEIHKLMEVDFDDEPELERECDEMVQEVFALRNSFNSLLERIKAARIATLTRLREAAVEKVKAIEKRIVQQQRDKAGIVSDLNAASERHGKAQGRYRRVKYDPPERSRSTNREIRLHAEMLAEAGKELDAASGELNGLQMQRVAAENKLINLNQELRSAEQEVQRITAERSRLDGTGSGPIFNSLGLAN